MISFKASGNPVPSKENKFLLCFSREVTKMVKLSHIKLKSKIAEQNWKQDDLAEKLDISDRHIRNLCSRDTDTKLFMRYRMSRVFGTTMEE